METTRRGFFGLIGAAIVGAPAVKPAVKLAFDFARNAVVSNGREIPAEQLTIESLTHAFTLLEKQREAVLCRASTLLVQPELYQTALAILDENSAPMRPGDFVMASPYVAQPFRLTGPEWFKVTRAR